jgi:hypothetical protein
MDYQFNPLFIALKAGRVKRLKCALAAKAKKILSVSKDALKY